MALYTHLSQKELARIAKEFGLERPARTAGILEGTVNTFYRLSYPDRSFYLKIDEIGDRARLQREIHILKLLQTKSFSFETPKTHPTKTKASFLFYKKKFLLLLPEIKGRSIPSKDLRPVHLRRIGEALGQLHQQTLNFKIPDHRFNQKELQSVFQQIKKELTKKIPTVALEIYQWLKRFKKIRKKLPSGLIHADLFPENILFINDKLHGILDFEAAGYGPFVFDLAVTLHACCTVKGFDLKRTLAFFEGYQSVRKITHIEWETLEEALLEACLRFLLTRLRDFELKKGKIEAPWKDYKDYLVRFAEIPDLIKKLISKGRLHFV